MLDFSNRTELTYLADLARAFGGVSGDMPYFLAGATARDLLLEHAHGINPGRNTSDLDLALMVAHWAAFEQLRHYLDAGNLQRLNTEASHLLDALDFDYEEAGAWLLGHDMARLLPESAHPRLQDLLNRESDANGPVNLVGDLPIDADRGLKLLQNLAKGFLETQNP